MWESELCNFVQCMKVMWCQIFIKNEAVNVLPISFDLSTFLAYDEVAFINCWFSISYVSHKEELTKESCQINNKRQNLMYHIAYKQ